MSLVDSHCHINFEPLGHDVATILDAAKSQEVETFLCVAINLEDFPQVLSLAERFEEVYASVGVHPNERDVREPTVEELVALSDHERVIAIGETGLDYFRSDGDLDWQRERFRCHIRAARSVGLPIIVHCREAADDTMAILSEEGADGCGGVMHCFAEDWQTASKALDLGFYISFSGIVTFKSAETLREVARRVPDDRILVETDAPYLAPVPMRGKTNQPAYVRYTAECVAGLRDCSLETVADITTENFFRLFGKAQRKGASRG